MAYEIDIRRFTSFPEFKKRFLTRINKECFLSENKDKCWNWQGGRHWSGHGQTSWVGTKYLAHRISYIIFNGLIPNGLLVRHTCNNPSCINPKHLILGSHSDNSIDSVKAGTQRSQVLNEECVKVIKWMLKYKPKRGLSSKLARLHKVRKQTISSIKKGLSWTWVKI